MKKLFALLVAAAGMFLLTGCSDSPKDVAGKWVSAIVEGDAETANKYSTDNVKLINAILIDTVKKNDKKSLTRQLLFTAQGHTHYHPTGDNAQGVLW